MQRGSLETLEQLLNAFTTRVVLSIAILISLVPSEMSLGVQITFLVLFGSETLCRAAVVARQIATGNFKVSETVVLLIDILATLSFIPGNDATILRMGRIARLLLLVTYWGPLARDFLSMALQRERLSQILLVSGMAALLTGIGAGVLRVIDTTGIDANGDGKVDTGEQPFSDLLWWSFRQVEDPGNLIPTTDNVALLIVSLLLTGGGLLLIAFLIGIGASLVEDLIQSGRQRQIDLRGHTLVLNVDDKSAGVLSHIAEYVKKQFLGGKIALQGSTPDPPAFLSTRKYHRFNYRSGHAADVDTLERLNIKDARRVAILNPGASAEADADVVTATINARRLAPKAWIVSEMNQPTNIAAALRAGGNLTIPVPARRLSALVVVQELVDPGRVDLVTSFVTLDGHSLYTAVFGDGVLSSYPESLPLKESFGQLRNRVLAEYDCLLIGYLRAVEANDDPWTWDVQPILNPSAEEKPIVRGLIGIASEFKQFQKVAEYVGGGELTDASQSIDISHDFDSPLTRRPHPHLRHVLILGFHDDTVEIVGELLRLFPRSEITIVGESEIERDNMRDAFLRERMENGARFNKAGDKQLALTTASGETCGTVHIRVADRYADGLYQPGDISGRVGNAFDYDACILLANRESQGDPDAATVLGVLKLLDRWPKHGPCRLKSTIAEISDTKKESLLRERTRGGEHTASFSFVQTTHLRNQILAQSFFIPGLAPVVHNILTAGEQEIVTLHPNTDAEGSVSYAQLVAYLGDQDTPLIPIGIREKDRPFEVQLSGNRDYLWSQVDAVYCLTTANPKSHS